MSHQSVKGLLVYMKEIKDCYYIVALSSFLLWSKCNSTWMTEGTQSISVSGQWEGACKFGGSFSGASYMERAFEGEWHALVSLVVFRIVMMLCQKKTALWCNKAHAFTPVLLCDALSYLYYLFSFVCLQL